MIPTMITVLMLVFLLGTLLFAMGHSARRITSLDQVGTHVTYVSIEAFRNLTSAETTAFLQHRCPSSSLTALQRERWRIASDYVRIIARNAAVFAQAGQLAALSDKPVLAQAGIELAGAALHVRVNALRLLVRLQLLALFPLLASNIDLQIPEQYVRVRGLVESVCAASL